MSEQTADAPKRWVFVVISIGITVGTALLVYWFECKISG